MSESNPRSAESSDNDEIKRAADIALSRLKMATGDFIEPGQTAVHHSDGSVTRYVSRGNGAVDRQEFAKDGDILDVIPISRQQSQGTDY